MAAERDPYVVLGVDRGATQEQIRAAYLALAAQYHPDRHQGNPLASLASEKLIEINLAYERLADRAHRRADGDDGERPRTTSKATPRPGAPPRGSGAYRRTAAATAPRPPVRRNYGRIVVLLALLPVIARFGAVIVRGIAALLRELVEGLTVLRGTPAGAVAALLATLALALVLVRRLRRASTAKRAKEKA